GAVARAFAREGAKVFLTGRKRTAVEAVARDIVSAGGFAETAEVDALDEKAIDKHLQSVISQAGRRRHSVQPGREPGYEGAWCASGRVGARAVLPAAHELRNLLLPDRAPRGPTDGREQVGGDHDRQRNSLPGGHPIGGRLWSGAGRQGGTHAQSFRRA